jgi:hypothetical protein
MTSTKDSMAVMMPEYKAVTLRTGEKVEIIPIKVGKLTKLVKALEPISIHLPKAGTTPASTPLNLGALYMKHPEEIAHVLAVLLDKDDAWVANLDLDDLVTLLAEVVAENIDFFTQRVLPFALQAMEQLKNVLPKKGPAPTGR